MTTDTRVPATGLVLDLTGSRPVLATTAPARRLRLARMLADDVQRSALTGGTVARDRRRAARPTSR